jgi:hypothetical protein
MADYAMRWNVSPRDSYGQKIVPKSDTDRYTMTRAMEGIAPRMAAAAANKYGHDHLVTKYFRRAMVTYGPGGLKSSGVPFYERTDR